jgi:hypothetical protein
VAEYIARLEGSFVLLAQPAGLHGHVSRFRAPTAAFRYSRMCWNWKTTAAQRRAAPRQHPRAGELRAEMADFILRHKEFPAALQRTMAERLYLEGVNGEVFGPFSCPDGQGLGQPQDHAALLSRPLGRV